MTEPPRLSYVEVLQRQAAQVDNVADQYALVMDGGAYDTSEVIPARLDAAALRALARRLEQLNARYWPTAFDEMYEAKWDELRELLQSIAAGFTPTAEAGK